MLTPRITRRLIAVLSLCVLPLLSAGVGSRSVSDQDATVEVTLAALSAVRPLLGDGAVALDASGLCTARLAQWSCPGPVRLALSRLRMVPSSPDFTHVCPSGPGSCRLVGVRHLVLPGSARIRGDSARIEVELISAAGDGGGLRARRQEVHLARQGRRWRVIRIDGVQ